MQRFWNAAFQMPRVWNAAAILGSVTRDNPSVHARRPKPLAQDDPSRSSTTALGAAAARRPACGVRPPTSAASLTGPLPRRAQNAEGKLYEECVEPKMDTETLKLVFRSQEAVRHTS